MRVGWLCAVLIAARGAGVAGGSELSAVLPATGAGVERGIAFLRCATATEGVFQVSRGAILDVGAPADVLLATAHGLPPNADAVKRDCRVLVRGRARAITEIWHAGGDRVGPTHDWVVIVTPRIAGGTYRWRIGRVTDDWLREAIAEGTRISLVLRSADAPQKECRFEAETQDTRALVAHSCVTHPGMSGSPIVTGWAGEPQPVLIAVHVGSQVRWTGMKLDFVSVARPVDAEIAATIEAAVTYSIEAQNRRRRGAH